MLKLFVILMVFLMLALGMLGLHHHRMELTAQTARIREQIRQKEYVLADQQVQIAKTTNPLVLAANLKASGIDRAGIPPQPGAPLGGLPQDLQNQMFNADLIPAPHTNHVVTVSTVRHHPTH